MKNYGFNGVNEFRYSVTVTIDFNSVSEYLKSVYGSADTFIDCADCMLEQAGELECEWNVRIYGNFAARRFADEIMLSSWNNSAIFAARDEITALQENEFILYADNRDELNECMNVFVDHCKRHNIRGFVSAITLHVRPIENGAREF